MCVSMCVCLCVSEHVHVRKCMHMWKLEINVGVSFSITLHLIFETRHLSAPGAHHFGWTGQPASCQHPPVPMPSVLEVKTPTTTPGFSLKAGDLN